MIEPGAAAVPRLPGPSFDLATLAGLYAGRGISVPEVAALAWERSSPPEYAEAWIHRVPRETFMQEAAQQQALLERYPDARRLWPLLGVPFAVKDSIDVAGAPTTAACPAYARTPPDDAPAVKRLRDAGALFLGKTNLDQFGTGLVGVRSPYGACRNPFQADYISGGSSSGSALAVSTGMVSFALGTDTAGSGRIPAAFTSTVGLKPSRGLISLRGVVPACPSLDCVSVFALTAADAFDVLRIVEGFDAEDPHARVRSSGSPAGGAMSGLRFGVPRPGQLDFAGDADYEALYAEACARLRALGGTPVEVDASPFLCASRLLYQGPWLAERLEAIGGFIEAHPEAVLPLIGEILAPARRITGTEVFRGLQALRTYRRQADLGWKHMDCLLLPAAPTIFTRAQIAAEPIAHNTTLGRFVSFGNLLDLCVVALPAGFRPDGLPFGVTLAAPALHDDILAAAAAAWQDHHRLPLGATGWPYPGDARLSPSVQPEREAALPLLVFGLHLAAQPLHRELTSLGARFDRAARTAPAYRMALLRQGQTRLPGVWRPGDGSGASIEGEVWSLPQSAAGAFLASLSHPLCLGTVELEDGTWVKGFLAESEACADAPDITSYGGWRGYLRSLRAAAGGGKPMSDGCGAPPMAVGVNDRM